MSKNKFHSYHAEQNRESLKNISMKNISTFFFMELTFQRTNTTQLA